MFKKSRPRLPLTMAGLASQAIALLLVTTAWAQDTSTTTPETRTVVVTGTYLESEDAAGTLSVTPVEMTEPINMGYSTVADVLRTKLPQYGGPGNLNPSFGNGGDGNSYLALRGLPNSATLLLVNGRRTSLSALNLLPDAAIDRIEILNDGGSAIYGSDAIAGVVNVILKKNFQGTQMSAYYGYETDSPSTNERKFQLVSGDTTEKGSFVISAEYSASEELLSPDRSPADQARGTSGTGNPGTIFNNTDYGTFEYVAGGVTNLVPNAIGLRWYVNPNVTRGLTNASQIPAGFNPLGFADTRSATNASQANAMRNAEEARLNALLGADSPVQYGAGPRFPFPRYTTLYRPHEKYDFSGTAEYKLVDDYVKFYADVYYVNYESTVQLAPSPLTGLSIPLNNYWFNTVFPAGEGEPYAGDLSQNYRIVELGPRIYTDEFEDFRFVGGLKGDIVDTSWKWDFGYLYTRGEQFQIARGGVVMSKLNDLLGRSDPGAWNPFGYTPIFGNSVVNDVSALADQATLRWLTTVQGVDFAANGEVIDLPGGPVRLALGFANRRESFEQAPDLATKDGLISPFNTYPAYDATRTVWGGFGEILVPITGKDFNIPGFHELTVSAAIRYEDYDDVGDTGIKPRVSGSWTPVDKIGFSLKGSYAEGFSAPSFGDLYSPPGQNFIEVYNPYTEVYEQPVDAVLESGNANLKPTDSQTWLIGGQYSPTFVKRLTIGMDYYNIQQTGIPFQSADYFVQQWYNNGGYNNPNNPWGPNAQPSGVNPGGTQVEYDIVNDRLQQIRNSVPINAGERTTDGLDFSASYGLETDYGLFTFSGLATFVLSWEQQDVAGAPTVDYLGRYWSSGAALPDTGYPEWRANASVAYSYKRWSAAFGFNYCDGYTETFNDEDRDVEAYITLDVRVGWKIPYVETDLLVGVNNLAGEAPPAVFSSFENNADRAIADPRGRTIWVSLSKHF